MSTKNEPIDGKKPLTNKGNRFEAMSWLYRDGLSYGNLIKPQHTDTDAMQGPRSTPEIPMAPVAKETIAPSSAQATQKQAPNAPVTHTKKRNGRFESMGWLYRDGLQNKQSTPTESKPRVEQKGLHQKPISGVGPEVEKNDQKIGNTASDRTEPPKSKEPTDKYEAMRWMFDSDESYEKEIKKLKAEDAARAAKKERARQARWDRARRVQNVTQAQTRRVAKYVRTEPRRVAVGGGIAAVLLVFAMVGFIGVGQNSENPKVAGEATVNQTDPDFKTLLPNKDSSQADSGIAYDEQRKVANYIDRIDSTKITVSQQPLPERFTVNQQVELEKFANEINANQLIQAGDIKAYTGLSVQGPQTVVFIKNDLLVFVKADTEVPTGAWIAYIESLE